jgi:hypothetical protein
MKEKVDKKERGSAWMWCPDVQLIESTQYTVFAKELGSLTETEDGGRRTE